MITFILILLVNVGSVFVSDKASEENTRYIVIEAECKSGFNALPENDTKVILTKVFKREFENAFEMVNAEPELITDFEVALDQAFPNQRNNIKDILVYMLNTEQEAKELYKRKLTLFKTLKTAVIELKIK